MTAPFEKGIDGSWITIQLKLQYSPVPGQPHYFFEFPKYFPLAGDVSNRRHFRIVFGETTYVLMVWEPFDNVNSLPF